MGIFYKVSDDHIYEKYKYMLLIQTADWTAKRRLAIGKQALYEHIFFILNMLCLHR